MGATWALRGYLRATVSATVARRASSLRIQSTLFLPPTSQWSTLYSCATSLVSFELIHIKRIDHNETAFSNAIEDMMHKLQISMGVPLLVLSNNAMSVYCCDEARQVIRFSASFSAQNLSLQNQRLGTHRR